MTLTDDDEQSKNSLFMLYDISFAFFVFPDYCENLLHGTVACPEICNVGGNDIDNNTCYINILLISNKKH